MEKVLISACLLGEKVKYHGGDALCCHPALKLWREQGRLVMVCPEVAAGFPTPRPPAEIVQGGGEEVLGARARILEINGRDLTHTYIAGAHIALRLAISQHIKMAILKEDSPSCGSHWIYDGSFSGSKKEGRGVTAALLEKNGIRAFSESRITDAEAFLKQLESESS
jgi:uncharacterized protein YbbK (DUF523 family)